MIFTNQQKFCGENKKMSEPEIREVNYEELSICLELIHVCFKTVADRLNLTQDNCPGHTSYMPIEKLQKFWDWGFHMYGLYENQKIIGYISISQVPDRKSVYAIHNLCVLPEFRKNGYVKQLLDYAKQKAKDLGGKILFVDFIEEDQHLRGWYIKNGFIHKGTEKYDHLIFTVGKAEYLL